MLSSQAKKISPPNMTEETPTSPSNLLTFINGHAVACYGNTDTDAPKKVKPNLQMCMKVAVQNVNRARKNRELPFDVTTDDEEPRMFVVSAFGSFYLSAQFVLQRI